MATGPMFANIKWGTYALFAALNGVVIFPVVYVFFPETKKYSLEDVSWRTRKGLLAHAQLDIIFALAHDQGKNPVAISLSGNIPEAGSPEADAVLGRSSGRSSNDDDAGEVAAKKQGLKSRMSRVMSREKVESQHKESTSTASRV